MDEVLASIPQEVMTHGQMQGYGWLHLYAVQQGFVVSQDTIRCIDETGWSTRRRTEREHGASEDISTAAHAMTASLPPKAASMV